jgi:tRNA-uridine 2-sulfurtransferase
LPDGIGLISGGLDSLLAMRLMMEQDLELLGIVIDTGFSSMFEEEGKSNAYSDKPSIIEVADKTGFPIEIIPVHEEYWKMVKYPRYGYGKHVNPCLDCRILMLRTAARVMYEKGGSFVFTGEVMGQRPKSQLSHHLKISESESGLEGRLLRPLSAKRLPLTIPEKEGLVNRDLLEGINGRGRKRQLELARQWGLETLSVAGGANCFLIDGGYSMRMKDLFRFKEKEKITKLDRTLLRFGRHLRLSESLKLIVSRNEDEHRRLLELSPGLPVLECTDVIGAIGILCGTFTDHEVYRAGELLGRYSKGRKKEFIHVALKKDGAILKEFRVRPEADRQILDALLI